MSNSVSVPIFTNDTRTTEAGNAVYASRTPVLPKNVTDTSKYIVRGEFLGLSLSSSAADTIDVQVWTAETGGSKIAEFQYTIGSNDDWGGDQLAAGEPFDDGLWLALKATAAGRNIKVRANIRRIAGS
jgi:hypothetical protein